MYFIIISYVSAKIEKSLKNETATQEIFSRRTTSKDIWNKNLGIEKRFDNKEQKSTSLPTSEKKAQTPSLQSTTSQPSTNLQTESPTPSPTLTRIGRTVNPPAWFLD